MKVDLLKGIESQLIIAGPSRGDGDAREGVGEKKKK